jgi:hypothetical protein
MARTLAHLLVRIGVDAQEFGTKIRTTEKTLDRLSGTMRRVGNNLSLYVTAPMLAAAGASLKMAIDAQESENLFEVAMGGMAKAAREFSEDLRDQLGLNSYEVRRSIATFNQMFVSMGLGEKAAFEMSKGLVLLANDMASFFNLKPEEAFDKLRAGITGEAEPLKRLGILIDENTIKQEAYNRGLVRAGGELSQIQKVQARYLAIMRQTSNAQGDLARTIDSPANQLRVLRSQLEETAIEFGTALLPLLKEALPVLRDLADYVKAAAAAYNELSPAQKKIALGILATIAAAGPASRAFGLLADAMKVGVGVAGKLAGNMRSLEMVFGRVAGPAIETSTASRSAAAAMAKADKAAFALKGSLVVLAGVIGWELGKAINEWLISTGKFDDGLLDLKATLDEDLLDALVRNEKQFHTQIDAYNSARKSLGLMGEEWIVAADHTEENSRKLAENLTKLEAIRDENRRAAFAIRETTDARGDATDQVQKFIDKMAKEQTALETISGKLREMYGVLSKAEVVENMNQLVADFTLLRRDGVPATQLMEKFAPKVEELREAAKGYHDLNIPQDFSDLAWALDQGQEGWVGSLADSLVRRIPEAADVAKVALESSIGESLENATGKAKEEADKILGILQGLAAEKYEITVTITPDPTDFERYLSELGIQPTTTGEVPP